MPRMALQGTRVLDLTHSWAGPHCTRLLADFGAEVVLVEYIRRLSIFRGGRIEDQAYDHQPSWHQVNRSKLSVTLDLRSPKDRAIFVDLVKTADIVVENSRTGVMERLGLAYADLQTMKPDLILLSMPAYGGTGPHAAFPAYGAVLEAMSGIQSLTAYEGDGAPKRIRELDVINGVAGACAALTALLHRRRTGMGQHVDLSQMEVATHALVGAHLLACAMKHERGAPVGDRRPRFAPQGSYPCKGEDRWVTLSVRSETDWRRFCQALRRPAWLTDSRFCDNSARVAHRVVLDRLIGRWTSDRTHYEAMKTLQGHGVPAGAVLDVSDLSTDPHLRERRYFVDDVKGSSKPLMGFPFRLSRGGGQVRWRGPDLGQHNEEVIRGWLGRPSSDVPRLCADEIRTAYDPDR